jgi:hypothetical protein
MVEVDRLTRLSPNEWKLWYRKSAQTLGVAPETLCDIIEAKLKDIKAAERAAETEKRRQEARAEKSRECAQRDIDKAAARKSKDKAKAFADIAKLPSDCTEPELTRVSERLGEDLTALRDEFSEYAESSVDETAAMPSTVWRVEPWPEPVVTATLLRDLIAKIDQHFAARHPHEVLAIALWVTMAWVHEVAATHSAFLMATSAEPDSGGGQLSTALLIARSRRSFLTRQTTCSSARPTSSTSSILPGLGARKSRGKYRSTATM